MKREMGQAAILMTGEEWIFLLPILIERLYNEEHVFEVCLECVHMYFKWKCYYFI